MRRWSIWSLSGKGRVGRRRTLLLTLPLGLIVTACGTGGGDTQTSGPPTVGHFCVNGPQGVAAGPAGSVYVLEGGHLLRVAPDGRVLWRRGADRSSGLAVDTQGNVYDNRRGAIEKIAPSGRTLAGWPSRGTTPAAVDRQSVLYALNTVQTGVTAVTRISPSGRTLGIWRAPITDSLALGADGTMYALGASGALSESLLQLSPRTGTVLRRWPVCHDCRSYDALTSDARGTLYVGTTTGGSSPFSIARVSLHGAHLTFSRINQADELVFKLAVDARGTIYVVRNSYARPGPVNTGLDRLSSRGALTGTFRPCHPNA